MNLSSGERPVCLPVRTTSGSLGRDEALAVADGVLVELGGRQVGADVPADGRALGRGGGCHMRWTPWAQAITI